MRVQTNSYKQLPVQPIISQFDRLATILGDDLKVKFLKRFENWSGRIEDYFNRYSPAGDSYGGRMGLLEGITIRTTLHHHLVHIFRPARHFKRLWRRRVLARPERGCGRAFLTPAPPLFFLRHWRICRDSLEPTVRMSSVLP